MLVVDDDAGIRDMLAMALRDAGHAVRLSDGHGPVAVADADVVLLDGRLGDRTAHDVIAETPELAHRPVILMTATGAVSDALSDRLAHMSVLRKPFDLRALEAAIDQAARGRIPVAAAEGTPHR